MFRWFKRHQGNYDRKRLYTDHAESVRLFAESNPHAVVDTPRQEIMTEMLKDDLQD